MKKIEALKQLQRRRELKLFDREEITGAVRSLALDHSTLAQLEP